MSADAPIFEKVAIVGLGLLGSSLARAIRNTSAARVVVGFDSSRHVREAARDLGFADTVLNSLSSLGRVDLVVLAVPMRSYESVFRALAPRLRAGTVVSDLGSVKRPVATLASLLPEPSLLVPAHPIAGTQHSGPTGGAADLFAERWVVLTPTPDTDAEALRRVRLFWERLGAHTAEMDAATHDRILGLTSHLPHAAAWSLVSVVESYAASAEEKRSLVRYTGRSFQDFSRVAASDPKLWSDIFLQNREEMLSLLTLYRASLEEFETALRDGDEGALARFLARGRKVQHIIQRKSGNGAASKPKRSKKEA